LRDRDRLTNVRHILRPLTIALTLAAFLAGQSAPALAQQAPPEEPGAQSTSPDPDEATAEQQSSQAPPPGPAMTGQPQGGVSLPDGAGFEARIRASAAASEGLQGPMDGGWTVRTADGEPVYGLQLVDPGNGDLQGAWRDMRRVGAVGARGLVANLTRVGDDLTIRFFPHGDGNAAVLELHGFSEDVWSGTLLENGGETPVSLTRNEARPTGDYSGVPRGPVMPSGYRARPRHVASEAASERRHGRGDRHAAAGKSKKGKGRSEGGGKGGSKKKSKDGGKSKGGSAKSKGGAKPKGDGGSKKKKKH
jgi:hypothetical protein